MFFIDYLRKLQLTDLEVQQTLSDKVKPDKLSTNCTKATIVYVKNIWRKKKTKRNSQHTVAPGEHLTSTPSNEVTGINSVCFVWPPPRYEKDVHVWHSRCASHLPEHWPWHNTPATQCPHVCIHGSSPRTIDLFSFFLSLHIRISFFLLFFFLCVTHSRAL